MNILFIAPVPPPITGQSLAVQVFKQSAEQNHEVELVDLSKDSFKAGFSSFGRLFAILRIWQLVHQKQKGADRIYFTTSESVLGNLKDLVIYWICRHKLSQTYIHMHGGEGMKKIIAAGNWLTKANAYFLRRLRGVIVLGNTQVAIYEDHVPVHKLHTVPNFALDEYYVDEALVVRKFADISILRILYLSNLVHGKGYKELLKAYTLLSKEDQSRIQLDFAGGFSDEAERAAFLSGIDGLANVHYHGVVAGNLKADLLRQAHVFCLPTYFPYEGQPISILEAYASGCCVVTTNHAGIFDTFTPGINGVEVRKGDPDNLQEVLSKLRREGNHLMEFGLTNLNEANAKYRLKSHLTHLGSIVFG